MDADVLERIDLLLSVTEPSPPCEDERCSDDATWKVRCPTPGCVVALLCDEHTEEARGLAMSVPRLTCIVCGHSYTPTQFVSSWHRV